jgi:hypothetical protein
LLVQAAIVGQTTNRPVLLRQRLATIRSAIRSFARSFSRMLILAVEENYYYNFTKKLVIDEMVLIGWRNVCVGVGGECVRASTL